MHSILLLIGLLILLFINIAIFNGDIISPSFIFCGTFLVATIDLVLNITEWGDISLLTVFIILGGCISFMLSSFFIKLLFASKKVKSKQKEKLFVIKIRRLFLILFFFFQILCIILVIKCVISLTFQYGGQGNIFTSISLYQHLSKFTDLDMGFPIFITYAYIFVMASGFVWGYILVNNWLAKKKIEPLVFVNFIVSIASGMLTGSRGGSFQVLIATIFLFVLLYYEVKDKYRINFRIFLAIVGILTIFLFSFKYLAAALGRDASLDLFEYISVYLGAPIKNLDVFLKESNGNISYFWGGATFSNQISWLNSKFSTINWQYLTELPFRYINGHNMGNVYTTFYPFINDFGVIGVFIYVPIMSIIMQLMYENIRNRSLKKNTYIDIHMIIYAFLLFTVTFSFFIANFMKHLILLLLKRCYLAIY